MKILKNLFLHWCLRFKRFIFRPLTQRLHHDCLPYAFLLPLSLFNHNTNISCILPRAMPTYGRFYYAKHLKKLQNPYWYWVSQNLQHYAQAIFRVLFPVKKWKIAKVFNPVVVFYKCRGIVPEIGGGERCRQIAHK